MAAAAPHAAFSEVRGHGGIKAGPPRHRCCGNPGRGSRSGEARAAAWLPRDRRGSGCSPGHRVLVPPFRAFRRNARLASHPGILSQPLRPTRGAQTPLTLPSQVPCGAVVTTRPRWLPHCDPTHGPPSRVGDPRPPPSTHSHSEQTS